MIDFLSLTDIPTPYRIHFYQVLHTELERRGLSTAVWFMDWEDPEKNWHFSKEDLPVGGRVLPYMRWHIHGRRFRLNWSLPIELLRASPKNLLISGGWFFPSNQLAFLLTKLMHTKTIFWSESNLRYGKHPGGIVGLWRRWSMMQPDVFLVPGQFARDYVKHFTDVRDRTILTMPNIVNEVRFRDGVKQRRANYEQLLHKWKLDDVQRPIIVILARLVPIKGIESFLLSLIESSLLDKITILIAGDGPMRGELEQMIVNAERQKSVRFLGFLEEEAALSLLAIADGFALSSIGDAFPLSAIEAAFAGLPLLLSNRVGCHPELLVDGENGYLFDPYNAETITHALQKFIEASDQQRYDMGQQSLEIANNNFATDLVIKRFVDDIMQL